MLGCSGATVLEGTGNLYTGAASLLLLLLLLGLRGWLGPRIFLRRYKKL